MLGKEVVFIGMGKRAEIWDKARWDAKNAEVEADIEDIASGWKQADSVSRGERYGIQTCISIIAKRLTD